jgi:hypothetical protein
MTEVVRIQMNCQYCYKEDLAYTCFCYDCKLKVYTPDYALECPNSDCNTQWIRTEYSCNNCNQKVMIYDAMLRYWFFDKLSVKR